MISADWLKGQIKDIVYGILDKEPKDKLGRIDPDYTSGAPRILFDGEETVSGKGYPFISSYTPLPNERVYLKAVKGSYIIIGKISKSETGNGTEYLEGEVKGIDARMAKAETDIKGLKKIIVNVQDYGATGDGTTDDTKAFRDAIKHLDTLGGGTLFVPKTKAAYFLKDYVILIDNLTIKSNGAIIKKNKLGNNYYAFVSLSGMGKGYGSGANNIRFDGLVFEGSFSDVRGISITLHHATNVEVVNCIFREAVVSGHVLDLLACSDVLIRNCQFVGFSPLEDREYSEAIQIDNSTAEGSGSLDQFYDGLPCKNITVQNCRFIPLTVNGTKYPAPNPMGSHSRVEGQYFTNIKFLNNYVEGGVTLPTGAPYAAGWLHFYHTDGLEIAGNTFKNTEGNSARILGLYTLDNGLKMADVNDPAPPKLDYTPLPNKNVIFRGNKIDGFKNIVNSRLIYLQGREAGTTKYFTENISITENSIVNCFDTSRIGDNVGADFIYAERVSNLSVLNNFANGMRRLLYASDSKKINVSDNHLARVYYAPVSIDTTSDVTANNNKVDRYGGGFYFREIKKLKLAGNTFVSEIDYGEVLAGYGQIISINNCQQFNIRDTDIEGSNGAITAGINVYGSSSSGRIRDNFITGFSTAIAINENSTNVISS